jgi:hypothetical protein
MRAGFSPRKRCQACTSYRVHTRTRASSASGAGKPSSSAICRGTRPARRAALAPDAAHNYAAVAPKGPLSALVTCSRDGPPDVASQPGGFVDGHHRLRGAAAGGGSGLSHGARSLPPKRPKNPRGFPSSLYPWGFGHTSPFYAPHGAQDARRGRKRRMDSNARSEGLEAHKMGRKPGR